MSIEIKPFTNQRLVTAAGTPEKVKEAPEWQQSKIISVTFRAHTANAGYVYLGFSNGITFATDGFLLSPGETITLDVHDFRDAFIDLSKIYIDAANNGDGVSYIAFEVL